MRPESIFEKISYLDKLNKWITLKSTSNYTTDEFKIETFFFLNKKCFKLKQADYDRKRFYFSTVLKVLEIHFNKSIIHQNNKIIHLMSRVKNNMEFTTNELRFQYSNRTAGHSVYIEPFELVHEDKFTLIKNPFSLFYGENEVNDPDKYLKRLMTNYKTKLNMITLNLPVEKEAFSDKIDDDLFEQYYLQVQNITDHQTSINSNYKRIFTTNDLNTVQIASSDPDLSFHLILFKKKLMITNLDNFTKLILNLLNALSIWFGLGVLDLHVYVYKIKYIFLLFYRLLLKIEISLYHCF